MTRAIARGIATMFRHQRLASILWIWSLVLGAAGAAPAIRLFSAAWPSRPEADAMLSAFDFPLYFELSNYDTSPTWAIAMAGVVAAALVAFVGGAFMTAGAMYVLLDHDESERTRTLWSRFGRGGGHAFWRSLTVSSIHAVTLAVAAGFALAGGSAAFKYFEEGPSEAAAWLSMLGPLVPLAVVVVVLGAVVDYARLRVVADPVCGAFRAWFSALSFTLRHLLSTTMIWTAFAAMTGVVLAASFVWSIAVPTRSTGWLVALVLAQQGVMLARAMIRVGALGAEVSYAEAKGFALPELPGALVDVLPRDPVVAPPAASHAASDAAGDGAPVQPEV